MSRTRQAVSVALVVALLGLGLTAQGQTRRRPVYRTNDSRSNYTTDQLIRRLETDSARFRSSLNDALDQSRYNGTSGEDNINYVADDFDHVIGHLRDRFDRRQLTTDDVQAVLARATRLDNFVRRNRLTSRAQSDWSVLSTDLNDLARTYNVAWNRSDNNNNYNYSPYPPTDNGSYSYDRGLTGTYRLNTSLSENPRTQAEQATRNLPYNERRRINDEIMARLESPAQLAIERNGNNVTIASTRAPQISFVADGTERTETNRNGATIRSRANFYGDELTVSTSGDRGNDFAVTFDPLDNGRRLQVTRRITANNISQPIIVRSMYERTADVAQFDVYNGQSTFPTYTGQNTSSSGDFAIPDGTTLVATLNNDISTQTANNGDRFTLTVREPSQYQGATIDGTLANVKRSGRITGRSELTLNFDTIRLRDGRSYRFAGFVDSVRSGGENISVDNEGTVRDSNQTTKTEERAAIGTAVGAIIGAIAGGGKGAAIGAVLGAGGGAGSVYVQGKNDLNLRSGDEVTIRASAPR